MTEQLPSEQFAIGEVAFYWNPGSPNHGKEVTIISLPKLVRLTSSHTGERFTAIAHDVDVPPSWSIGPFYVAGRPWSVQAKRLRKKRPPREDLTVVRWAECPWQPTQVRA